VRRVRRALLQGRNQHVLDLIQQDRRRPARPRLIHQARQPVRHEPGTPPGHRPRGDPQLGGHLLVRQSLGTGQHDLRAHRQRLRRLRPPRPAGQLLPLGLGEHQLCLRATRPAAIDQAVAASPGEPLAPQPHRHRRHAQISGHPLIHHARLRTGQNDPRSHRQPRRPTTQRPAGQLPPLVLSKHELGIGTLPARHPKTIAI
jgi:hypothetical protein